MSAQFLKFLLAGGVAALANYGSRFAFQTAFSFSTSVLCAYLVGMLVAYTLTRLYVFDTSATLRRSGTMFALVNVAAVAQTWLVSVGLASYVLPWLGVTRFVYEIAHAVGVAVPVLTSFFGHKYLSFPEDKHTAG